MNESNGRAQRSTKLRLHSSIRALRTAIRNILFLLLTAFMNPLVPSPVLAGRVYVDVTSPNLRPLPIAVQNFVGGKEISDKVKNDLDFTGLFHCIDEAGQIESPDKPFSPMGWQGLGTELVVKGKVLPGRELTVVVTAHDVSTAHEVLNKEYSASPELAGVLAHSISNDIYNILTGGRGIFRSKIAFVRGGGDKREVAVMDWDGGREFSTGVTAGIVLTPRWSNRGDKVLYSAERNRQWGIYLLDMGSMKEKSIVNIAGLNMSGNFFPDGHKFVFASSMNGNSNIYIANIDSMKGEKLVSSPWIEVSPSISPDGNQLLFVSNRSGSPQVYIADKDGNGIRRLTFEGNYNTSPAWSPRGDRIVYTSMVGGANQVFVMKTDGSGSLQLTDKGSNEEPCFSPDGRYIAFSSNRDGVRGIYLMRTNGEGQHRITPKGVRAVGPSWSP